MIFGNRVSKNCKINEKLIFFSISLVAMYRWSFLGYYEGESRHHPIFQTIDMGSIVTDKIIGDYLDDVYKYDSQLNTWNN